MNSLITTQGCWCAQTMTSGLLREADKLMRDALSAYPFSHPLATSPAWIPVRGAHKTCPGL
jgi:hypothetical protein